MVRKEVVPFLAASIALGIVVVAISGALGGHWLRAGCIGLAVALVSCGYMLFFFRDPERHPPDDPNAVVAGADGILVRIADVREDEFLKSDSVRLSIFLSLFDVHVNRAPLSGRVKVLDYRPGKRFFTFQEKSSEFNQHNVILIEGERGRCLLKQIVGPVCRRVVHWLSVDQSVATGERIGMMKFGSRLDMVFPTADVEIVATEGQTVRAGETVVARLKESEGS